MQLILWRHAQAEPAYANTSDLERALTPVGQRQAQIAAQWLNAHLPLYCRIWVSPALRTRQTADALARPYDILPTLAPDASVDDLLTVTGWSEDGDLIKNAAPSVTLVIGHQPTLGETAAHLLEESARWVPTTGSLCWVQAQQKTGAHQAPATLISIFTPNVF